MYKKFFGLKEHPFRSTPDEDFFYEGSERGETIEALLFSLTRGDAIVSVIGEVGSGKTTLVRVLANRLKKLNFELVYIPNPNFSSYDILVFIANELGLKINKEDSKFNIYNSISAKLLNIYSSGKRVAVIIDEAHLIPLDTLEEIRLLSNIETGKEKLLSIILVGQPELKDLLSRKEARQLNSRITYEFLIQPFNSQEVHDYLNFRMRKAGFEGKNLFPKKISYLIGKKSKGLPRVINNIADQLLLKLYAEGRRRVKLSDITHNKTSKMILIFSVFFILLFIIPYLILDNKKISGFMINAETNNKIKNIQSKTKSQNYDNDFKIEMQNNSKQKNTVSKSNENIFYNIWNSNQYVIGLLTTSCNDEGSIQKVVKFAKKLKNTTNLKLSILVADYYGKNDHWCKVYVGGFDTYNKAKKVFEDLPKFILKNSPFIIEVRKIENLLLKRNANVNFINL